MNLVHSILITGASGTGKSTLIRGALETYGSGVIISAPGMDELDSYLELSESPSYLMCPVDDPMFQPALNEWECTGHKQIISALKLVYAEVSDDVKSGKEPRYKVLGIDTISACARLAYNATLSKFRRTEPPPAIGSDGAPFYGYLRITLESQVRLMRAIRGLGVHWIAASHPKESEVSEIQKGDDTAGKLRIVPDMPGGFRDILPSFFSVVVNAKIGNQKVKEDNKEVLKKVHYLQWSGDPKRVTKSRFGALAPEGYIVLPTSAKSAWETLSGRIEKAANLTKVH